MKAHDIMTKDVVFIRPETSVREIAALMTEKRISGLPVLGADGTLLGIVSQSDLLHRWEIGTEPKYKWWLKVFSDSDSLARAFSKTHGIKAKDVMTCHIISVKHDTDLGDVAALLDRSKVKRLPVLQNGRLVGLITRSDLVKAFSQTPKPASKQVVDDALLQRALADKMRGQTWLNQTYLSIVVDQGIVQLWGYTSSHDQRQALKILIEETDGVKSVDDRLSVGSPMLMAGL
jgi:CBS domain-containing protein